MGHGIEGKNTPPAQLDADSAASVAATLQALATPSRLRILTRLRHGACSVNDLSAAVEMEQSAVSHQLRLLRAMVGDRRPQRAQRDLRAVRQPCRDAPR